MNAFVRHIGIIDHAQRVHGVTLERGVNIITGRSSTGKSALIEIFDYCFGSSDFTIPQGVITRHANIYFAALKVGGTTLVLARKFTDDLKNKAFLAELFDDSVFNDLQVLSTWPFDDKDFTPLDDFKKEVGKRFGLTFTDVDEDREARLHRRNQSRPPSPSIRSFTSFMLQHQNLVANKHAIFYRFDQKEKRDQVIEHFKSFVGFATPEYFQPKQELGEWEKKLKSFEAQLPRAEEARQALLKSVTIALADYSAASGTPLLPSSAETLISRPERAVAIVRAAEIQIKGASNENEILRRQLEGERSFAISKKRDASRKLMTIRQSIEHIQQYRERAAEVPTPEEASITVSKCPFCDAHHSELEAEANKLDEAIRWLNQELEQSLYLPKSLVEDEAAVRREIEGIDKGIQATEARIKQLDLLDVELSKNRPVYEQAVRAKLQLETILERVTQDQPTALKEELEQLKERIAERKAHLDREYNVDRNLRTAEKRLNEFMGQWGRKFEFEKSFDPITLQFSLESFDLWHQNPDGVKPDKVYLRSMGSGANWLYSHVTLFLALHRYFCERGHSCLIPSILFLDQPSQVYFQAVLDTAEAFDAESIAKKLSESDPDRRNHPVDDDIQAVTNLYSRMVEFCELTKEETGIEPQIIVTDHADGLTIEGDTTFDSLVRSRWRARNKGLIDLSAPDDSLNVSGPA